MPWFGQGGKKHKHSASTELQSQKAKQIDSLRNGNLKVAESIKDVEYRVSFQVTGVNTCLIVFLPPHFPQDRPEVKVEPRLRHAWVDQHMKVTGCPNINNFSVHSSLYTAIQAIIEDFMTNPPNFLNSSVHVPPQPATRGYPSLFPMTTNNIFNIYPSMNSTASTSPTAETNISPSQASDPVPSSNISIPLPDMSQMTVTERFPHLQDKSCHELVDILEGEGRIMEEIQALPEVHQLVKRTEELSCQCKQLAKENLEKKPLIEELKQTLREKLSEFESMRDTFERRQEQQLSLMDQFHPTIIQNNLKVAILEAEEESDRVVEEFLDKKINVDEFQQKFLEKRSLYHTRRVKEEKMSRMVQPSSF